MSKKKESIKVFKVSYYEDKNFDNLWKIFLESYPYYSYRYTRDYISVEKTQIKNNIIDLSFIIHTENTPLCLFPLIIDLDKGYAWYNEFKSLPAPLFDIILEKKQIKDLEKIITDLIKTIFEKNNINRWYSLSDPTTYYKYNFNEMYLDRFLSIDFSCFFSYIDLTISKEERWNKIRSSYRNLITNGLKVYEFKIYDHKNCKPEIEKIYKELHIKCSGKQNRPDISYKEMFGLVKKKNAIIFDQFFENKRVQTEIVGLGKKSAIGLSVADDPSFHPKIPLTHSMNHAICKELKKRGVEKYETGYANFEEGLNWITNDKIKKIRFFKRGFGNSNHLMRKWIWFKNRKEELNYYKEQLNIFKKTHDL